MSALKAAALAVWDRIQGEPVLTYNLVGALVATLVAFGLNLSKEETAAIDALTLAAISVLVRSKVSPA